MFTFIKKIFKKKKKEKKFPLPYNLIQSADFVAIRIEETGQYKIIKYRYGFTVPVIPEDIFKELNAKCLRPIVISDSYFC